jgi:spore maturation protein CgeB
VRVVVFAHSLVSDWNHGNAHFLRGILTELLESGHTVRVFEPCDGWSLQNLLLDRGPQAIRDFEAAYPDLRPTFYDLDILNLHDALEDADIVLVHEWNPHDLVRRIGEHHARRGGYLLFFHDTHHRSVTDPGAMSAYDLTDYDGVLAYGGVIRDLYRANGWAKAAWTWHEAADTRIFRPRESELAGDLVWIGNWGDGERAEEIEEFLIRPVEELGLRAKVYGVRYPAGALRRLEEAGIEYGGWLPNYRVPEVFARYRVTVHIPRRPYTRALPGIPTIRPFEALACGIPMVSAPWEDSEGLFCPGRDFLVARNGSEMTGHLRALLADDRRAAAQAAFGLAAIRARHTCAHRVGELLEIVRRTPWSAAGPLAGQISGGAD